MVVLGTLLAIAILSNVATCLFIRKSKRRSRAETPVPIVIRTGPTKTEEDDWPLKPSPEPARSIEGYFGRGQAAKDRTSKASSTAGSDESTLFGSAQWPAFGQRAKASSKQHGSHTATESLAPNDSASGILRRKEAESTMHRTEAIRQMQFSDLHPVRKSARASAAG